MRAEATELSPPRLQHAPQILKGHLPQLDGIRGAACLMVLVAHYVAGMMGTQAGASGGPVFAAVSFLLSGVDLFFVLSGFLIGGILMDHRQSHRYFSTFYLRRICRILPVYLLLIGSFSTILLLGLPQRIPQLAMWLFHDNMPIWSFATFTQNIQMALAGKQVSGWAGITWSLAVEEQFYLLLPLAIYSLPTKAIPWLAIVCFLVAMPARYLANAEWGWFAAYVLLPCRLDALMAGVLAAWLLRQGWAVIWIRAHQRWLYTGTAVMLAIAVAGRAGTIHVSTLYYSAFAMAYALALVLAVCDRSGVIARLFGMRGFTAAGIVSYGIYMYEQAIGGLWHAFVLGKPPGGLDLPGLAVTAAAIVTVFVFSYLSYRYYEMPIRNWGKRFRY